tara:strand:- start:1343 stop:1795 length:453 start_codon:yes stop_codon:yes gene_type:complete
MKIEKIINNQNVLYLVIALAVLCSLGYLCVSSYECLAIFAVVYFICCNYIKNKLICLSIALFVSNFVFGCSMTLRGSLLEGYSNSNPVRDVQLAGLIEMAENVGEAAGEKAAVAVAEQGASEATQEDVKEDTKELVKQAVVQEAKKEGFF